MKGKPIEPGCLAMIVRANQSPVNNGKVVRVRSRAYEGYKSPNAPAHIAGKRDAEGWIVEVLPGHPLLQCYSLPKRQHAWFDTERCFLERCLIRLDDDEAPKEVARTVVKSKPVDEVI